MLLVALFLFGLYNLVLGAPFPSNLVISTLSPRDEAPLITKYRSTPEIIWTCLVTTFLCTWVSAHPNVAGYNASWWHSFRARLRLFLGAFTAPEIPLVCALMQWMGAKRIAEVIGHGWNPIRGHFLQMGGIIFLIDGEPVYLEINQLLNPTDERHRVAREALEQLPITEKEILDRSKGDAVTKGITVLQTLWFIVLLAARRVQNLTVTALEVLTLAYAVLNLFVYIFWWNKPLNVHCPVVIALPPMKKESHPSISELPLNQGEEKETGEHHFVPCASPLPAKAERPSGLDASLTSPRETSTATTNGFVKHEGGIWNMESDSSGQREKIAWLCSMVGLSVLSGAVYFVGWSFTFPTPIGRTLWRFGCIFVTVALFGGILMGAIAFAIVSCLGKILSPSTEIKQEVWNKYYKLVLLFFYFAARLILISLALWSLNDLPRDAYETVSWSRFIPHF